MYADRHAAMASDIARQHASVDAISARALSWTDLCQHVCSNGCCATAELASPVQQTDTSLYSKVEKHSFNCLQSLTLRIFFSMRNLLDRALNVHNQYVQLV